MDRSARVWKRILAFLIDLYFALAATWSFLAVLATELPTAPDAILNMTEAFLSPLAVTLILYTCVFVLLYHVFCEYVVGQTPGMLVLGLRVQNRPGGVGAKAKDAKGIGFWQALGRNLFVIPILPFSLFWLIEPLYYLFHGERLLEHWTRTETVE